MKKIIIPLAVILFVFLSIGLLLSQENEEDAKFNKTLDKYLDALWKFYPTAATMAGYHKYDNKLEALSNKKIEKRHDALDEFNKEFVAGIDRFKLSPELQIDHEMIIDALDLELLKHENLVPWEYNPLFYNDIFSNCVRSLFVKEFAPPEQRTKNAADRLKALPKFIKQAKENLKTPPLLLTETAIKQFSGIMDFYQSELPVLIEQAPEANKSKLQANLGKVLPALEDYKNFLQNELLPRSTGNFRMGPQAHTRLLRLTIQNNITMDTLIARATADFNNIRREMALVCLPYFRIMYPNINMEKLTAQQGEEKMRNTTIKGVLDKIKRDHVTKEEFINQVKSYAGEIKNFLTQKELLELPEESLSIELIPPECRGITWSSLVSPGVYETSGSYASQIIPLPNGWEEDQINSFLEEYNNFLLYFWTVRKVYPGQFVPTFYTRKYPSIIRNMHPNLPLIKAWPVFMEEMLVTSGFGNYDLMLRLSQLKLLLKVVMDFQVELNIHQGGMTKESAISYLTIRGFQSQVEAKGKVNRIILKPGDCAYTYVGYQEILDMQKEYKELKGESYNHKEFFKKLLSYGALPLRHLKKKILEQ